MTKTEFPQAVDAPIVIIGGGGHTRVLIDVLETLQARIEGIVTQDETILGTSVLGIPVLGMERDFKADPSKVLLVNGVGNRARTGDSGLKVREAAVERYRNLGFKFASVISPHAVLSRHTILGEGVQVLHDAVVQPVAHVGAHTVINSAAVVEHDCRIGTFCHVAPGAVLCGNVVVGHHTHIGANATVVQGLVMGDRVIVAAGVRVARNVASGETVK